MWINFVLGLKKFTIELTGEETFDDVQNILKEAYGFKSKLSFMIDSKIIPVKSYFIPIQEILEDKSKDFFQVQIKEVDSKCHVDIPPDIMQQKPIVIGDNQESSNLFSSSRRSKRLTDKKVQDSDKLKEKSTDKKEKKKDENKHHKHHSHHRNSVKDENNTIDEPNKKHKHHKSSETSNDSHKHHKSSKSDDKKKDHKNSDKSDSKSKHHSHHKRSKEEK